VLTARKDRGSRVSVCGYLVDVYCLGVKNAIGPEVLPEHGLYAYRRRFFGVFPDEPLEAPIELAQHLIFGAAQYARSLGFEPHPDFEATASHLGSWTGPSAITFGRDRKPCHVEGPYDGANRILETLSRRSAGITSTFLSVPAPCRPESERPAVVAGTSTVWAWLRHVRIAQ
jgi:hypothetical protein